MDFLKSFNTGCCCCCGPTNINKTKLSLYSPLPFLSFIEVLISFSILQTKTRNKKWKIKFFLNGETKSGCENESRYLITKENLSKNLGLISLNFLRRRIEFGNSHHKISPMSVHKVCELWKTSNFASKSVGRKSRGQMWMRSNHRII